MPLGRFTPRRLRDMLRSLYSVSLGMGLLAAACGLLACRSAKMDEGRALAYTKACDEGDAKACGDLVTLYTKACEGGNGRGCSRLGAMYEQGRGVPKDAVQARSLHGTAEILHPKACDGGNARACAELGALTKDEAAATSLFIKACDGGD